jgi:hypothetical protein
VRKGNLFCQFERSEESLFDLSEEKKEIPRRAARLGMAKVVFSASYSVCMFSIPRAECQPFVVFDGRDAFTIER